MRPGLKFILLLILAVVNSESRMGQTSAADTAVIDVKAAVQARFSF
jgi:hypothetical protein